MKLLLSLLLFCILASGDLKEITLAKTYRDHNISGWYASEKLDGVRGVWNGEKLLFRSGNSIYHPKNFTKNFPPFPLDGELWIQRGAFAEVSGIIRNKNLTGWEKVTYNIFDVPIKNLPFKKRIEKAKNWFKIHPNANVKIIPQTPVKSRSHLEKILQKIESKGGEGVMVRDPDSYFERGRSETILKVKSYFDKEAKVIGYKEGKGKYKGKLGSLKVVDEGGNTFFIGSGLTDKMRENPPKVNDIITFKYYGLTKNGKYRFPVFLRMRNDYDWKE